MKKKNNNIKNNKPAISISIGLFLLGIILSIIGFFPIIKNEIKYLLLSKNPKTIISINYKNNKKNNTNNTKEEKQVKDVITPVDTSFSIIIPKIGINTRIIKNVNPFDKRDYLNSLKNGVAHSKTSGFPNDNKNTFIFAHSSNNFYNPGGYNSVFYLLYKLNKGDIFYIVYKNKLYKYEIQDSIKVDKNAIEYLYSNKNDSSATLMTCWPPGTAKKRLLVTGKLIDVK